MVGSPEAVQVDRPTYNVKGLCSCGRGRGPRMWSWTYVRGGTEATILGNGSTATPIMKDSWDIPVEKRAGETASAYSQKKLTNDERHIFHGESATGVEGPSWRHRSQDRRDHHIKNNHYKACRKVELNCRTFQLTFQMCQRTTTC